MKDIFKVANIKLKSRLIVGTGKYKNFKETAQAVKTSGADMVTVAVRRINILDKKKTNFNWLPKSKEDNLFTQHRRLLYFWWSFKNFETSERNGRVEIS